jgi:CubicO group peptidase (beta-lactamase class C family)
MKHRLIKFLATLAATLAVPLHAQAVAPERPAGAELTPADVQAWLDGLMPTALNEALVPGAVVLILKDGQPLAQKGYGVANWQRQTPVDPQSTIFRLGSISKLFTWTAVMQLAEQGRLDLDADVNRYLDFRIPVKDGKPQTLRTILTHTTGFEETNRDLVTFDGPAPRLDEWLTKYLPPQKFATGSTPDYSNYAAALAGRVVERVSGQSFDDYIEQHIFAPLGMTHSTFRQPLPAGLKNQLATGYLTREEPGQGFETVNAPPCGALSSTAADMGRFMQAYLQEGRLGNAQILKPETVRLMHTTVTRAFPDLNGMALGFYQHDVNGHRSVAHGGDTIYFHSDMVLFPDEHLGIFMSVNAAGKDGEGGRLRDRVFQEFADRYLPAPAAPAAPARSSTAHAHDDLIAGNYAATRGSYSNFLSLLSVLSPMTVVAKDNGTIELDLGNDVRTYAETAQPFLWQQVGGKDKLQAIVKDGRIARWSVDALAFALVYEPIGGLAGTPAMLPLLGAALAVVFLTTLAWPAAAFARRYYRTPAPPAGREARSLRWVRVFGLLAAVALCAWAGVFAWLGANYTDIPVAVFAAQALSLAGFAGGLAAALWRARVVFAPGHGRWARAVAVLWVLAFAGLLAVGIDDHLLGFNPNY